MHSDQNRLFGIHITLDNGKVMVLVDFTLVKLENELTVPGRKIDRGDTLDKFFSGSPIRDQVADRNDVQVIDFAPCQYGQESR